MAQTENVAVDGRSLDSAMSELAERLGEQPARLRFVLRGLRELERAAACLSESQLAALPAPSDDSERQAFTRALVSALASCLPTSEDPLARARLRGLFGQRELLAVEGPPLSAAEVGRRLGISRQAVDKRRRAGTLLAVTDGSRRLRYPRWQLGETGVLDGLVDVLKALADHPPWARLRFFLAGNHRLGGARPLDALRAGRVDDVVDAARAFGEQGAA